MNTHAKLKPVTSQSVSGQLAACRAAIIELEDHNDKLAFEAVSGDESAKKQLAETAAKLAGARRDEAVLVGALRHSGNVEADAALAAEAERRAKHMAAAREASKRLHGLAGRADALIAEFAELLIGINDAEKDTHRELHQAGELVSSGIAGRWNLAEMAMAHVQNCRAKGDFRNPKSLADIALSAWSDQLVEAGDDDI